MNNELSKLIDSKQDQEIETELFVIKNNLLRFDHLTLQLSNISKLYAGKKELKLPMPIIIIFVVSLFSIFAFPIIGIPVALFSGWYLYVLYKNHLSSRQYLVFQLNSGDNYYI